VTQLFGETYDRDAARRLTGHPQQVVGTDLYEALDGEARGQRFVRLRAGDIDCDVAVDRGLDLARLSFRGLPVHWITPAGFRNAAALEPDAMQPAGWGELRTWPGGMLSTFGYDHVGVPAVYPNRHGHPMVSAVRSPIHGRSSYSPTYLRGHGLHADHVYVEGEVRQAAPFAEHLVLRRTIRASLGEPLVTIDDTIHNDGYTPERVQLLYHFGFGWPMLAAGTHVRMSPTDIIAATQEARTDDPAVMPRPTRGATERVWDRASTAGPQWAALVNKNAGGRGPLAAVVEWDGGQLPHLIQWRIAGESMFSLGLELSTTGLDPSDGDIPVVEPGDARSFSLRLRFETGDTALSYLTGDR
jgi:hypothetical protein